MTARGKICEILATGPATRPQMVAALGLTPDMVIHATNGLMKMGAIYGTRCAGSGNGRPAVYSLQPPGGSVSIVSHALANLPDLAKVWA